MSLTAIVITGFCLIALITGWLLLYLAYELGRHNRKAACPSCGCGTGLHNPITGRCAGKVNTAFWLVRIIGVRQLAACKCVRRPGVTS
jgi:hypothetical protein